MASRVWFLISVAAACAMAQEQELTVKDVTGHLQARSAMVDDAVAVFEQRVKFGYSNLEQSFTGTLTMKKPKSYRIESDQQTLVTDGTTVWAYTPGNNQVLVDRYKENENSLSPEQFLVNLPAAYYVSLLGTEKSGASVLAILKLVPKDDRSFVRSVKLWIETGSWNVRRILIVDVNDTETTYLIKDIKLNTNVNVRLFTFSPPAGAEVVDLR
jgi:outer membrane lipoprotein carrier protein